MSHLRPREALVGFWRVSRPGSEHDCACHVTDEERFLELEKDTFIPEYYAVELTKLLGGFKDPVPQEEIRRFLARSEPAA